MIALLLVMLLQEPVPATLTYVPPKDSKPADVEKAAKAVEKRCAEYGYKGVTAKAVNGEVVVACETGITEAMTKRLEHFTRRACAKVEFMLLYPLTDKEAEQYAPGGPAPKGSSWVKLESQNTALVLDGTRANVAGKVTWKRPTKKEMDSSDAVVREPYFEFSEDTSKVMKVQADAVNKIHILLLIDGREAKSAGLVRWKEGAKKGSVVAMWKCEEAQDELGGICFNNPLPFRLEPKK
jgi:hypothetical protein